MSPQSSDTAWLKLLKVGDHNAAQVIWDRYFRLLVECARQRLSNVPKRATDEEDIALSAFASFCRGVDAGRFPRLDDRSDLRNILLFMVARKTSRHLRRESRAKRGGGKVRAETELARAEDGDVLAQLVDPAPTPELTAQFKESCDRLLDALNADDLRTIALLMVEGFTVDEVAAKMGRSPRTIARKLAEIRDTWSAEEEGES